MTDVLSESNGAEVKHGGRNSEDVGEEQEIKSRLRHGMGRDPRPLDADRFRSVTIYDRYGKDRRKPRAEVFDGWDSYQTIDILASIKSNPSSIKHPAIATAIKRWERLIRARLFLRNGEELYKIACAHLRRVDPKLLKNAKERRARTSTVFVALSSGKLFKPYEEWKYKLDVLAKSGNITEGDYEVFSRTINSLEKLAQPLGFGWMIEKEYDYLRKAWEHLGNINQRRRNERWRALEVCLLREIKKKEDAYVEDRKNSPCPLTEKERTDFFYSQYGFIEQIKAFFESHEGREFLMTRRSFNAIKERYIAWRFPAKRQKHFTEYPSSRVDTQAKKQRRRRAREEQGLDFNPYEADCANFQLSNECEDIPLVLIEPLPSSKI